MSGWWNRKVSIDRITPPQRQRVELLAGEQFPESDDAIEAAVLSAIDRYAAPAKSDRDFRRRYVLARHAAKLEPWSVDEAAKRAGCSRECVSRSHPKILQALAALVAGELAARGRSHLRPRSGL